MRIDCLRGHQIVKKALVLKPVKGTVQVVARTVERFIVTRCRESDCAIDRVSVDDGADAVVKKEPIGAGELRKFRGERIAGEWTGRNNRRLRGIEFRDFLAPDLDQGVRLDRIGYLNGKSDAINRQRLAARHA